MQKKLIISDPKIMMGKPVISMPSGVFKPYAGVSTAVLVFIKGDKTDKVWFYDMEADGYSLDDKRNFIDGKGDIPDIICNFRKRYELIHWIEKESTFLFRLAKLKKMDMTFRYQSTRRSSMKKLPMKNPRLSWGK